MALFQPINTNIETLYYFQISNVRSFKMLADRYRHLQLLFKNRTNLSGQMTQKARKCKKKLVVLNLQVHSTHWNVLF